MFFYLDLKKNMRRKSTKNIERDFSCLMLIMRKIRYKSLCQKNVPVLRIEVVFTADSTIFNFQQPMKTRDLFSTANENP